MEQQATVVVVVVMETMSCPRQNILCSLRSAVECGALNILLLLLFLVVAVVVVMVYFE